MAEARAAIIGGSGFYEMAGLTDKREIRCDTPFGSPSDAITIGTLGGMRVAFLSRHGLGHRFLPSEVPSRANIYALKTLGVERIISVNSVGSLRAEIAPRHLLVPNQLIDRTVTRDSTFFGDGLVAHVSLSEPFCPEVSRALVAGARQAGATVHEGGTAIVMEGPAFSTKAESRLYQSWGADIVSMTMLPEAKLAREAGICYAALALVTDYDVWHETYGDVTVEMILSNLALNVATALQTITVAISSFPAGRGCGCATALDDALITKRDLVPKATLQKLAPIIEGHFAKDGEVDGGK